MAIAKPVIQSGLMSRPAIVENTKPRMSKDEAKAYIARMAAYDSEMVTGIFENLEAPGQGIRFCIHLYESDDFDTYELFDGERYRLPRGVARHLNQGCAYKQYATLNDATRGSMNVEGAIPVRDGRFQGYNNNMTPVAKKHRVSFKSLEFSDDTLEQFQTSLYMPNIDKVLPTAVI